MSEKDLVATVAIPDQIRERNRRWIALDCRVLVVATEGWAGDWTAYIGAVPGHVHEREWEEVLHHGSKLPQKIAELLFPDFTEKYMWRR
jgi:hypothetical protein